MIDNGKTGPKLCISIRLIKPFLTLLSTYEGLLTDVIDYLQKLDLDDRVPIEWAHKQLEIAVKMSGDPDIGLKAGRTFELGDGGAFDYAAQSAATVQEAIEVASRGVRLLSDACDFRLEIDSEQAIVRLESRIVLPRAAADFQSSLIYSIHQQIQGGEVPLLEWWFPHAKPSDTTEYRNTFSPAKVRFSAPCLGFAFDKNYLGVRMRYAEPKLHAVMRKHIEMLLAELPRTTSLLMDSVKDIIVKELVHGRPSAAVVARRLHMSSRTLSRKLQEEGTSFSLLLDDVRRKLALKYVGDCDLKLSETSALVGFSDVATFYHAFKRWTGQTPLQYRQLQAEKL
ncbi:MAG: AraC family transcriptional regulator ligand-binding domain-containing protein [Deltaproteobacteria bacterium]|nr:AraC family transcriptional regulator ligand-binding domain-containing protein [Deltaproteobacteria bacterium]